MTTDEIDLQSIRRAYERIVTHIKRTPLVKSDALSELCGGEVYLKLENQQLTGTFKFRGALNKLSSLSDKERKAGVVTASSGNHAQGVALAAQALGIEASIFVPQGASSLKLEKLREYNVEIMMSNDYDRVEPDARTYAREHDATYISPYNDYEVMAGQGTIALELEELIEQYDSVIVPVGGGGLISGIAVGAKGLQPGCNVYGVLTPGAATLYWSLKSGKLVKVEEFDTLADAFLGGVEEGARTFDIIRSYVDDLYLVQEDSVADSIRLLWREEQQMIEGAGATGVALLLERPELFESQCVIAIVSGGNISEDLFADIIGH